MPRLLSIKEEVEEGKGNDFDDEVEEGREKLTVTVTFDSES